MKRIKQNKKLVNPQQHLKPSQLAMVLTEDRQGFLIKIACFPRCSICGEVITDLESANVEVPDDKDPEPEGNEGGAPISVFPRPVYVVHCKCGPVASIGPWMRASQVFRNDQRWEGEKCLQRA